MRSLRTTSALLSLLALPFVLLACGGGGNGAEKGLRIAVVPKGTAHEFWNAVREGAERADAEFEDLTIVWKGPSGEGATKAQQELVENLLADGYDGLCLAPLDSVALATQVKQALQAKVPVVIFDSGLKDPTVAITSFVATDNRAGGVLAAQKMVELLGGQGRVLVVPYLTGSESTEERERGFLEEISKHPGIELVAKDPPHAGPSESNAIEVGERLLQEYGDDLDGIFTPNESNVSGLLTVLRRDPRGLAGKVKLVGFDFSPNIVDGLRDGVLHATVLQDPVDMGYRAVKAMHAKLRGQPVEARIETGLAIGTPENYREPAIARLLGIRE